MPVRAQSACDDGAVDLIAVSDHVTGSPVPRKGLGHLTSNPLCCRVGCDVDPREVPTIEPHDDEGIKQVEANGRDNKSMAAMSGAWLCRKVRHPWLGGPRRLTMYLASSTVRLQIRAQFAMDTWRAPKRVFDVHPPDQYAQLRVDLRSPSPRARLPTQMAQMAM
jgi:hypothetical protein